MAEIAKLRDSLRPREPVTPAGKKPAQNAEMLFTPKRQTYLRSFCKFIHEGEEKSLLEGPQLSKWADVEEQLDAHTLPVLKSFLIARVPQSDIPARKPAAVAKIAKMIQETFKD